MVVQRCTAVLLTACLLGTMALPLRVSAAENTETTSWYSEQMDYAEELGIIPTDDQGNQRLSLPLSRGMLANMIYVAMDGESEVKTQVFKDVPKGSKYLCAATEMEHFSRTAP